MRNMVDMKWCCDIDDCQWRGRPTMRWMDLVKYAGHLGGWYNTQFSIYGNFPILFLYEFMDK